MALISLELERLRYPQSGLGQYCLHLSNALNTLTTEHHFEAYLPAIQSANVTVEKQKYWRQIDRYFGVKTEANIWHHFHQDSVYRPRGTAKRVLTLHDLNFVHRLHGRQLQRRLKKMQVQLRSIDGIAYISDYSRQCAQQYLALDHIEHQTVIHNGLSVDFDAPNHRPVFVDHRPFLFSLGIVGEKKNFHTLVPMMKSLPEYRLLICGPNNGAYADSIQKSILDLGLSDQVFLSGAISDAEKRWLFLNCAAFCFPSLAEGFGLPVIEALAAGKPTIISKCTSLPEIGAEAAAYFDNFEPVSMAQRVNNSIDNFDQKQRLAAVNRAAQFNWQRAAQAYLSLYQTVLD